MTDKEFARLRQFIKPFSRLNGFVYKLSGGRLMGKLQGRPVMLVGNGSPIKELWG